jgi:Mg-chelatase subunit ChlD
MMLVVLGVGLVAAYLFFWWWHRQTLTDMSRSRKRFALSLRLLIVTLLFLALAGTRWIQRNDDLTVIFLLDSSRSLRDDQKQAALQFIREAASRKRPNDQVGVVTFGSDPSIHNLPSSAFTPGEIRHPGATNATNLSDALRTALPLISRETAGKIVVLSDGNENIGNALAEVPSLAAAQVKVDTVLLPSTLKTEALIEKMVVPSRVKIGEPFSVKVVTNALNAQRGRLTVMRKGQPTSPARVVEIPAGRRVHEFPVQINSPGFFRLEASLETNPQEDSLSENNRGLSFVSVRGRPQVLYVASTPRLMQYLQRQLRGQNIDVLYAPPAAMPTTAAALQQFDSIILSDVPSTMLSTAQMQAIQVSVRDFGVGFGMIGGENSFGLGGYRRTAIEEALPVNLDIRKMQRFPPVCVAFAIDRSGSMSGRKLQMAIEAASRAVQALKPTDKAAVAIFDSSAQVQVPLTSAEQAPQIIGAIQQIRVGGGTSVYSGVQEAFELIKNDDTPIKHIILLTDGQSSDPDWRPLLDEMKKRKITLSAVGIGENAGDINAQLLGALAGDTGGRFYQVRDPKDIPGIYLQEIERISSRPIIEEPFRPIVTPGLEDRLSGIGAASMPPLLGYNVTIAKPTADVILTSHHNDPVYATWRYGLGRAMAFTSDDKNKWAVQWLPWSGYGPFWAQAIRWTMRTFSPSDFQTQVTMEGTRGHIMVEALDREGKFLNRLNFTAKIAGPEGEPFEIPLRQSAPGTYEGWFDAAKIGTYLVNVVRELPDKTIESSITGLVVPYSPEYHDLTTNAYLMSQLAQTGGGTAQTDPRRVFTDKRPSIYSPISLVESLLLMAMLLFPLDVAARRLALQKEDFRRALGWARGRLPKRARREDSAVSTPEMARLINVKTRASAETRAAAEKLQNADMPTSALDGASPASFPSAGSSVVTPSSNVSATPPRPTAPEAPSPAEPATEGGMGRLMAAKRRAQEQQKPREEE